MKNLLKVQKEIGALSKKSENPFFKSAYLDLNDLLNAVKPLLEAEGLILLQPINETLVGTEIYDSESNELIKGSYLRIPENITDPQKIGSCITYFRRYTLKSLLAIAEKDDDGQLAAKPTPKPKLSDDKLDGCEDWTKEQKTAVEKKYDLTNEQIIKLN
jgi:hypothetical protein